MSNHGKQAVLVLATVGGLSVAAGPATAQESTDDVRAVLARAEAVYDGLNSLEAQFEQTIEVTLLGRSRTGSGTWYQKGRGRFVMDFSDPVDDLIVADGSYLWLYYPSTHPGQV
ncbi:MAG: outer membrane lipoprotein carrier protein LolA, partial [Gemmatimonadota bacterium]